MDGILAKIKHVHGKRIAGRVFLYLLLVNLAFVFLYPFFYMIVTSLKSPADISDITVNWLLNELDFHNYTLSFRLLEYPAALLRTVGLVLACSVGHILSCSFVGYGFARFQFRGKGFFFVLLLMSIIVPMQTIIVPMYMLFAAIGLSSSGLSIILPTWFGFGLSGGLFIFLFRQFYLSLPRSLEEAASIDGCGILQTFFRIALPASRSSLLVCWVLSVVWHWNDYFEPSIYITERSHFLLPMQLPGLYELMKGAGQDLTTGALDNIYTEGVAMAATTLVILPVLIMYLFLQKQFVLGVERSGITGE
ncbi:MAG: carbohydrate ABC transporter permease [Clostridia bacterium]|nr:carbohydrate ABC transporter permease [Clostridia bacterium]